jgi:hypothetical protein
MMGLFSAMYDAFRKADKHENVRPHDVTTVDFITHDDGTMTISAVAATGNVAQVRVESVLDAGSLFTVLNIVIASAEENEEEE